MMPERSNGSSARRRRRRTTSDEAHQVLYELADALEAVGETARALAICIELQAEAGDYRDVAARIDRLSKVQTRG